jgi:hypothetical protein
MKSIFEAVRTIQTPIQQTGQAAGQRLGTFVEGVLDDGLFVPCRLVLGIWEIVVEGHKSVAHGE